MPDTGDFGKEQTMHLLKIIKKHLPVGSEGWKGVVLEHELHFPGRGRTALMRRHFTLRRKQVPTGDPGCPRVVKLARRIKHVICNKAAVGFVEEEFNLKDAGFGESGANLTPSDGANPSPPSTHPEVAATESATLHTASWSFPRPGLSARQR